MRLGMAAGRQFTRGDHRHTVVIGKDTRLSGYMLEPALTAGFISVGMDVTLLGPLPTPAVATLTRSLRADLGVMISASHNPFEDNGIKLFGPDGYKLSDEVEAEIEARMVNGLAARPGAFGEPRPRTAPRRRHRPHHRVQQGRVPARAAARRAQDRGRLRQWRRLQGGASALWELGADVIPIGVTPDGLNINKNCGSLFTQAMQQEVIAQGARSRHRARRRRRPR